MTTIRGVAARPDRSYPHDLSFQFLQSEILRIDVNVRRLVKQWELGGQDVSDRFRGLYMTEEDAVTISQRPLGSHWGTGIQLSTAVESSFANQQAEAIELSNALIAQAHAANCELRLLQVARNFNLSPFEYDAFLICLAPEVDLRYERLYGFLQDDVTRKRPSVNLILDLLAEQGVERLQWLAHFREEAPLFCNHLLERLVESGTRSASFLGQQLRVDPAVAAWLLGAYQPHAVLGPHAVLTWPEESPSDLLVAGAERGLLLQKWLTPVEGGERPILSFYGPDRTSQEAAARLCTASLGLPLLQVDLAGIVENGVPTKQALRLALRDARLVGALPFLLGWEVCLRQGIPDPDLLAELCTYPDAAIAAGEPAWQAGGLARNTPFFWLEFTVPAFPQRQALWAHYLEQVSDLTQVDELNIPSLAGQFSLTSGQIRDAVVTASDLASQQETPLEARHLFSAARVHSNPHLKALARKIEPRYAWGDIVLPDDQLALLGEIVNTVRGRSTVLEEWGLAKKLVSSAGVPILFAGEPGTGKTMAASIMASELQMDLYKVDLSTVVSKYIGETEKNLERIFVEAERSNAILFFDEADAIFGKRSEVKDAHDRYANIEISYLLQRMEMYDGVTILATNLRANLDEAFTRRLHFAVDFPFPEQQDRLRIWQTLFPPDVPRESDLDFELLASRFELSGGSIRNILVGAAYLAAADGQKVTMEHLLHSARRELQKMGRLVSESDMDLS